MEEENYNRKNGKVGVFVFGFICGIIATFIFLNIISKINSGDLSYQSYSGIEYSNTDGDVIPSKQVKIFQALDNRHGLAHSTNKPNEIYDRDELLVLFESDMNTPLYDDMVISLNKGQKLVQVGTYKYKTVNKEYDQWKTVPVVRIK